MLRDSVGEFFNLIFTSVFWIYPLNLPIIYDMPWYDMIWYGMVFYASLLDDDDSGSTEVYKSEWMMDGYLDDIEMQSCNCHAAKIDRKIYGTLDRLLHHGPQ